LLLSGSWFLVPGSLRFALLKNKKINLALCALKNKKINLALSDLLIVPGLKVERANWAFAP